MAFGLQILPSFCVAVVVVLSSCSLAIETDTSVYYLFSLSP